MPNFLQVRFYIFIILGIGILFPSCELSSLEEATEPVDVFFDLNAFFESEVEYLQSNNIGINKVISNNEKTEEHNSSTIDWTKELTLFSSSDINRPSWKEKYTVDSILLGDGLLLLQYKATDKKLRTELLDIKLDGDQVHSIVIVNKRINKVYESQEYLTYIPRKSYIIKKTQDVTVFDKDEYHIQAKYIYHESAS